MHCTISWSDSALVLVISAIEIKLKISRWAFYKENLMGMGRLEILVGGGLAYSRFTYMNRHMHIYIYIQIYVQIS